MDGQGYEISRFIGPVRQSLLCGICKDVPRDPRCCHEEHTFCLGCISQHLRNSPTCPECRQPLTPETLKPPPRLFIECWSELTIKCDFIERGCPEHVQLGNLQDHILTHCGFAPVTCENCEMQINRKDEDSHKKSSCQLGSAKCQNCEEIKASQEEMKVELNLMKARQREMNKNQNQMEETQNLRSKELNGMENTQNLQRQELNDIVTSQEEHHDFTNGKFDSIEKSQDLANRKIDRVEEQMKRKYDKMERKYDKMNVNVKKRKKNVDETQGELRQRLERVEGMLNHVLQGSNVNNNGAQAMDPTVPANNQDILGGRYGTEHDLVLNTVEKFNIVEEKSTICYHD